MNAASERAVADAVAASRATVTAAVRAYDTVCDEPTVLAARQRRGLLGLGKQLAGNPNASDVDRTSIDVMLGFIGAWGGIPIDDRMNIVSSFAQEAFTRPALPHSKPIASTDDLALCIALDAAALIRLTTELVFNTASLDIAVAWAEEGDTDADRVIATRLTMDTHTPIGIALGAVRMPCRISLAQRRPGHSFPGASGPRPVARGYDDIFQAAASDLLRIYTATRSEIEAVALDPTLGPEASYLAGEIANIAHNVAAEASEFDGGGLAPTFIDIAKTASAVAGLAAETAAAYETARKAMRE